MHCKNHDTADLDHIRLTTRLALAPECLYSQECIKGPQSGGEECTTSGYDSTSIEIPICVGVVAKGRFKNTHLSL